MRMKDLPIISHTAYLKCGSTVVLQQSNSNTLYYTNFNAHTFKTFFISKCFRSGVAVTSASRLLYGDEIVLRVISSANSIDKYIDQNSGCDGSETKFKLINPDNKPSSINIQWGNSVSLQSPNGNYLGVLGSVFQPGNINDLYRWSVFEANDFKGGRIESTVDDFSNAHYQKPSSSRRCNSFSRSYRWNRYK